MAAAARARAPPLSLSLSRQSLQEGRELVSVVRNRNQGSQSEREEEKQRVSRMRKNSRLIGRMRQNK